MVVYYGIDAFKPLKDVVVTQGTFDGVHLGHQKILRTLVTEAEKDNSESVVLTFFPHPRMVLFPDDPQVKLIDTMDEKIRLLNQFGVKHLVIQEFNHELSRLSAFEFVRNELVTKLGMKKLIVGYDHRFGRNREGDFGQLSEWATIFGFELLEISRLDVEESAVSSTKVRNAIINGDLKTVKGLLGRNYSISGQVVHGKQLGRQIGFPTANIEVKENYKLLPLDGVYAAIVTIDGNKHYGMLNIGLRPTFDEDKRSIEINVFEFDENLYNKVLNIELVERIREEKKFEGIEKLKEQLQLDKEIACQLLGI